MLIDGAHDPLNTTASMSVSECCGASLSVTQSLAAFPASVAAKRLLIDCFQEQPISRGPVGSVSVCVCVSELRGRWPRLARTAPAASQSEAPSPRASPLSGPPLLLLPHLRRSPRRALLS